MLINQVVSTPYSTYGGILESYRSETTVKQNVCIGVYFENTGSYPDTRDSCSEPRESQSSWGCPGSAKTPAFFYTPPPLQLGSPLCGSRTFCFFFLFHRSTFRPNVPRKSGHRQRQGEPWKKLFSIAATTTRLRLP